MTECQTEVTAVTVEQVEDLALQIKTKRAEKDAQAEILSKINGEIDDLEQLAVRMLKEIGKTSYKGEHGTLTRTVKWSVTLPKTEEDRAAFFAYLKEKGIFEKLVSVPSPTLNSYYMQEWEASKDPSDPMAALDFKIPGISEPKSYEALSFRKK